MNRLKRFLADPTPWSLGSIRWFWIAAGFTVVMVVLAYVLLWFGVEGRVPAWIALLGQGVSVLFTAIAFWAAYRARKNDIRGS